MQDVKGIDLPYNLRREVLRSYVHRYTGEHKPQWVKDDSTPVQFKDDEDWLRNTTFKVTNKGTLSRRHNFCESSPTWPNNPELRRDTA